MGFIIYSPCYLQAAFLLFGKQPLAYNDLAKKRSLRNERFNLLQNLVGYAF
jgi:hypothetical protein